MYIAIIGYVLMVSMSAIARAVKMKFVGDSMCFRVNTIMFKTLDIIPKMHTKILRWP